MAAEHKEEGARFSLGSLPLFCPNFPAGFREILATAADDPAKLGQVVATYLPPGRSRWVPGRERSAWNQVCSAGESAVASLTKAGVEDQLGTLYDDCKFARLGLVDREQYLLTRGNNSTFGIWGTVLAPVMYGLLVEDGVDATTARAFAAIFGGFPPRIPVRYGKDMEVPSSKSQLSLLTQPGVVVSGDGTFRLFPAGSAAGRLGNAIASEDLKAAIGQLRKPGTDALYLVAGKRQALAALAPVVQMAKKLGLDLHLVTWHEARKVYSAIEIHNNDSPQDIAVILTPARIEVVAADGFRSTMPNDPAALRAQLATLKTKLAKEDVTLGVHSSDLTSYGDLVRVLDAARDADLSDLGLDVIAGDIPAGALSFEDAQPPQPPHIQFSRPSVASTERVDGRFLDDVAKEIHVRLGAVKACVGRASRGMKALKGTFQLRIEIATDGTVANVAATVDGFRNDDEAKTSVTECVTGMVRRWRFVPPTKATAITATLAFSS